MEYKFKLGSKVKDTVSGYTGILNARSENLNGCIRYSVQAPVDKDMKMPEGYWFDEVSLELIEDKVIKHEAVKTGGPMSTKK